MAISIPVDGVVIKVRTSVERRGSQTTEPKRSFCRRAFCCLGSLALIPTAIGLIAFLGAFGEITSTQGAMALASGFGLTSCFETCLIVSVLQELKKNRTENKVIELS